MEDHTQDRTRSPALLMRAMVALDITGMEATTTIIMVEMDISTVEEMATTIMAIRVITTTALEKGMDTIMGETMVITVTMVPLRRRTLAKPCATSATIRDTMQVTA